MSGWPETEACSKVWPTGVARFCGPKEVLWQPIMSVNAVTYNTTLTCIFALNAQGGNNNTYCHDSELNWFNWDQANQDETGYARFFRCLVNLRSGHNLPTFFCNAARLMSPPEVRLCI